MNNLYEKILSLCNKAGIRPGKMCNDIGLSRGMMTDLKMGRKQTLSTDTLSKIALYFDVTVDELLGNEKEPVTDSDGFTEAERRDIALEVERMMADLEHQGDLMFDGDPATPEALETIRTAFMIGLTQARKLNKQGKKYEIPDIPQKED